MPIRAVAGFLFCILGCVIVTGDCHAQNSAKTAAPSSGQDSVLSDQQIDLMRKDLRAEKKKVVAANMNLTSAEAEKFWPVYDEYTAETIKINDKKYELIKGYADNYGHMTDQQAEEYVQGMAQMDEASSELRKRYWSTFRRVIPAKKTALFFQIDWRIMQMIDLQACSQIPLIEP